MYQFKNVFKLATSFTLKLNDFCFEFLNNLEHVELSYQFIDIGRKCFFKCFSLSEIIIESENGIKISNKIIFGCKSLKNFILKSKSSINICDQFMNDSKLESVKISGKNIVINHNCS